MHSIVFRLNFMLIILDISNPPIKKSRCFQANTKSDKLAWLTDSLKATITNEVWSSNKSITELGTVKTFVLEMKTEFASSVRSSNWIQKKVLKDSLKFCKSSPSGKRLSMNLSKVFTISNSFKTENVNCSNCYCSN